MIAELAPIRVIRARNHIDDAQPVRLGTGREHIQQQTHAMHFRIDQIFLLMIRQVGTFICSNSRDTKE